MEYLLHLAKDKKLKKLIDQHEPLGLTKREDIHFYLCASIMSQQLSTKVAHTIRQRFLLLYGGLTPSPEQILTTPPETLRSIGLSNAKVGYVHNVARFAIENGMDDRKLHEMDNEAVIAYLTQIKGVGRWTVEMLLMFGLGREDIFAIDDWGIQNAMIGIYKLDRADKKAFRAALLSISDKWSPYRTYACLHLWRWKDNSPVVAAKKADGQAKKPVKAEKKSAKAAKKPTKGSKKSAKPTKKALKSGKKRIVPKKKTARGARKR